MLRMNKKAYYFCMLAKNWNTETTDPNVKLSRWIADKSASYEINWSNTNELFVIDPIDNKYKLMKENHLKCILKRDVEREFGKIHNINQLVDGMIEFSKYVSYVKFMEKIEDTKKVKVEGFIK
jgi:hypothetical protein